MVDVDADWILKVVGRYVYIVISKILFVKITEDAMSLIFRITTFNQISPL